MNPPNSDPNPPPEHTTTVVLASGESLLLRPMRADDAPLFGVFLRGLSPETRSYWRPHPYDQETADAICAALDPADVLRLIALARWEGGEELVAYCTLKLGVREADGQRYAALGLPLDARTDAAVAPCVADAYQNRGVGALLVGHALEIARAGGRRRVVLWGGVQARNTRGIRLYTRLGFRKVGEFFTDQNNLDMIVELMGTS